MPFVIEGRDRLKSETLGDPVFGSLLPLLDTTFGDVEKKLNIQHDVKVNVCITDDSLNFPVCGQARSANEMDVNIDRKKAQRSDWQEYLKSCLYHEGNHVTRIWKLNCNQNFEQNLALEGLATNFELENGSTPHMRGWNIYNPAELAEFARKAPAEFGPDGVKPGGNFYNTDYTCKQPVYALGHAMVKLYLNDTGKTAAEAVHAPTDEILPYLNKVVDPNWTPSHKPVLVPTAQGTHQPTPEQRAETATYFESLVANITGNEDTAQSQRTLKGENPKMGGLAKPKF